MAKARTNKKNRKPRKPRRSWPKFLLKWTLILGLIAGIAVGTGVAGLFYYYSKDLPQVLGREDFKPPQMTRVYARGGELIAELARPGGGKRTVVPMDKIPQHVRDAFMAAEDADFMTHSGIDLLGMVRAFYYAVAYDTGLKGTSTITQQVVKNLILTPERSYKRKLQEIMLARELEKSLAKEDILWLYLNELYMGHGVNGVEEAAQLYFGKPVSALSLEEGAVLAGITQSPERHSPKKHMDRAKKRRHYVLKQLWEKGFIEESEYRRADKTDLIIARTSETRPNLGAAPHFVEHVRKNLLKTYGEERVYTGGLRVHTTLDLDKQHGAEDAMRAGLAVYDKRRKFYRPIRHIAPAKLDKHLTKQDKKIPTTLKKKRTYEGVVVKISGASVTLRVGTTRGVLDLEPRARILGTGPKSRAVQEVFKVGHVVRVRLHELDAEVGATFRFEPGPEVGLILMEPSSRDVLALIGGYEFALNRYNHATQSTRQTGSTFKPFIYGAALAGREITPATLIHDTPVTFQLPGSGNWSPKNSDGTFRGPIRIREALGASRNVVAVKVLERFGVKKTQDFARTLGISSKLNSGLTMALGSSELRLLEMVNAYATLASGGSRSEPRFITRIETMSGEVEKFPARSNPVIAPEVAYLITSIMQAVTGGYTDSKGKRRRGTGSIVKSLGHPVAGKTGTTNDSRDAWFLGFTPYFVGGVWVGRDDNKSLGKKEYGGKVAAPIWLGAMKHAHQGLKARDFAPPNTGVTTAQIDPKTGLLSREKGITETFLTGSAPTEYVPEGNSSESFLLDQFP